MRILVIEDEPAVIRTLERGLGAHGYTVLSADNGEEGVMLASSEPVDLVLLDIALPGLDGHQTLARLRSIRQDLPILMLTARDDLGNKVAALEAGADDYLTKPFALEELVARIRAMTRRSDQRRSSSIEAGDMKLDLLARRCWRGDAQIDLSSREFALLEYFLRNPGRLLTRQQILSAMLSEADRHSERSDESPREAHLTKSDFEVTGTMATVRCSCSKAMAQPSMGRSRSQTVA